jgi:hypothetical protein
MHRRVVQVQFTTSDIRLAMSQFVKRELHSLAVHMAGGIANDDALRTAYTRHFSQKVSRGHNHYKAVFACLSVEGCLHAQFQMSYVYSVEAFNTGVNSEP